MKMLLMKRERNMGLRRLTMDSEIWVVMQILNLH